MIKRGPALWYAILLAATVVVVIANYGLRERHGMHRRASPMTAFAGGTFEASDVVQVPGTNGVLFVDDDRSDEVFFMRLGEDRKQVGDISAVKFGAKIADLEGITTDGVYFYVVGSQSTSKGDRTGLARFRFDAKDQRVSDTQSIDGLKSFLTDNVNELRAMQNTSYGDGSINIEGIAWDPTAGRLLLGLRSPVVEGQALVVPLKMRDPQGAFSLGNMEVEKTIRLPLGGAGIRSIEYDALSKTFRLIAGTPDEEKMDFKLWEWSGNAESPALRETKTFDHSLRPEGITRVSSGDQNFIFIVFDKSGYAAQE